LTLTLTLTRAQFVWGGASDADAIDMAFSESRAEERKAGLTDANPKP